MNPDLAKIRDRERVEQETRDRAGRLDEELARRRRERLAPIAPTPAAPSAPTKGSTDAA
jgi:hypothetical protein